MTEAMGAAVVIDNGSAAIKAGFAGESAPRTSFPNVIGYPRFTVIRQGMNPDYYIGEEAEAMANILRLSSPVEQGMITDWDSMTHIWSHALYHQLRVTPSEQPVLLTEAPFNPKTSREKTTEIMFECFEVPKFYLANQTVLSLYSTGRTSGIVLDSGAGATHTVPIFQGNPLHSATMRNYLAGRELTSHLANLVRLQLQIECGRSEMRSIRDMKERLCYVALDFEAEMEASRNPRRYSKVYELPDKQTITLDSQRFRCPQTLFKPHLMHKELQGIHEMTAQSILNCDFDIRKELYSNIVISGGNTMFPGMPQRLKAEMTILAPANAPVEVVAPAQRHLTSWIGGAILSSLQNFQPMWITREQFQETGGAIVHRKCY